MHGSQGHPLIMSLVDQVTYDRLAGGMELVALQGLPMTHMSVAVNSGWLQPLLKFLIREPCGSNDFLQATLG